MMRWRLRERIEIQLNCFSSDHHHHHHQHSTKKGCMMGNGHWMGCCSLNFLFFLFIISFLTITLHYNLLRFILFLHFKRMKLAQLKQAGSQSVSQKDRHPPNNFSIFVIVLYLNKKEVACFAYVAFVDFFYIEMLAAVVRLLLLFIYFFIITTKS